MHVLNKVKSKGVTLIEALIVLVLTSIILSYAIPSFREFNARQKLSNTANSLVLDMLFVRSTAVNYGQEISLLSNNGVDWGQGWKVFIDANYNAILDGTEKVIKVHEGITSEIKILADVSIIQMNSFGELIGNIPTLLISHNASNLKIKLTTNRSGLTSIWSSP